jgi:hypothetical protein
MVAFSRDSGDYAASATIQAVTACRQRRTQVMRKTFVLAVIAALAPPIANAHVVRHNSIPEAYWGTWSPGEGACGEGDKSAIVLSAKAYVGPAGSCAVDYVSETPSPNGATYSLRLLCPGAGTPAKKTVATLIFRSDGGGGISAGATFAGLKAHRRCSASSPPTKG